MIRDRKPNLQAYHASHAIRVMRVLPPDCSPLTQPGACVPLENRFEGLGNNLRCRTFPAPFVSFKVLSVASPVALLPHAPALAELFAVVLRWLQLCMRVPTSGPKPERFGIMYNLNVHNIREAVLCAGTTRGRGSAGGCEAVETASDIQMYDLHTCYALHRDAITFGALPGSMA